MCIQFLRDAAFRGVAHVMWCLQVIETAFAGTFGGQEDAQAFAASQKGEIGSVTGSIGAWWRGITTLEERKTWAVLDLHNYIAWDPKAKEFEDISTQEQQRGLLEQMSLPFFRQLRERVMMPEPELLACSEYSASTNQDARNASSWASMLAGSVPYSGSWRLEMRT